MMTKRKVAGRVAIAIFLTSANPGYSPEFEYFIGITYLALPVQRVLTLILFAFIAMQFLSPINNEKY